MRFALHIFKAWQYVVMGLVLTGFSGLVNTSPARAEPVKRYASIVVDADTLEIIHARQIDAKRFPASLTKVMTLYLTFEALNSGQLKLEQKLRVSPFAAKTPPSKLGLRTHSHITVSQAIQALSVKSANDVAVVLAEAIAGTQDNFSAMMTTKARQLGMINTVFKNPHGLPHPDQVTTARDMAKLATAILNSQRRYYHYFGQTHFRYNGRTFKNTNALLHSMPEVDGFKTGYTNASGYNLIISAQKDTRRLIAVVLGGASGKSRNQHMEDLVRRGFKAMGVKPPQRLAPVVVDRRPLPEQKTPQLAHVTKAVRLRGQDKQNITIISGHKNIQLPDAEDETSWSIQVGAFASAIDAKAQIDSLIGFSGSTDTPSILTADNNLVLPINRRNQTLYRARFSGLTHSQAFASCKLLENLAAGCFLVAPG